MDDTLTSYEILESIAEPEDLKNLGYAKLEMLAREVREFLISKVSLTGGHLASNLGVVELTIALHKIFSTPEDKIIWDVGHQSYVHKMITGRRARFDTLRQFNGISGFPKCNESKHDCFNTGHSSTSISAALGMARARDINHKKNSVVAVIGDGALTGGMAFEALNDAGRSPNNLIVILNDNEMSITKNVGGLSRYLSKIRTQPIYFKAREDFDQILNKIPAIGKSAAKALDMAKGTIKYMIMPGIIFEELGFKYLGPIDGHNIPELCKVLSRARLMKGPVLIHVCTQKGRGYAYAEEKPHEFHGVSPFEIDTGESKKNSGLSYSDVFGQEMIRLAEIHKGLAAITAAMPHGTGLEEYSKAFPARFFDVGIAEQHAVTLAAGLAKNDVKPVVAVYSSFLQRAYDQVLHDVALQNLDVVFAIDRAGIVGDDGETHQGIYDLSYLGHIPNITIASPSDFIEFKRLLEYAVMSHKGPIAIRYPRGAGLENLMDQGEITVGKGFKLAEGSDITIVAVGNMVETALRAANALLNEGIFVEVINARFIKPLDMDLISESVLKSGKLLTLEDNTIRGGFGSSILESLCDKGINIPVKMLGFPDQPILQGSKQILFKKYGLDIEGVSRTIKEMLGR